MLTRLQLSFLVVFSLSFSISSVDAAFLPPVSSGTLIAQFQANDSTVTRNSSGHVSAWTASNNNSIALQAFGSDPGNIQYSATAMNGLGSIVVSDAGFAADNQVLRGALPGTRTATTIFWLGHYSPGRDGISDGSGLYAYSYGVDGADGSQLDHQMDSGRLEVFGGAGTQTGGSISSYSNKYTVWRTVYGTSSGNGHAAFADGVDLSLPSPNGGNYSVSGDLQLFGYQNSSGESGGFNFVGNMSELLIYDGILSEADIAAVESYLSDRRANGAAAVPEPSSIAMFSWGLGVVLLGRRRFRSGVSATLEA